MAQNKINNLDKNLRNRMRKYDTYNPNPNSSRIARSSLRVNKNPNTTQVNLSIAHHERQSSKPKSNTLVSKSKLSSVIALKAVREAKASQYSFFPDQNNIVYGYAKRKLTKLQKFMYGFGVVVLLFSMTVSVQSFITNKNAKDQIETLGVNTTKDEQGVSQGSGNEPSEDEISNESILAYQVKNPQDPRYIRIPEINVFARIKNLGIDSSGAVDAPHNIYDAGWYNGSARPGSKVGSSLILGHVSGWTAPGVFKKASNLKPGMQFEIEKGSGEKIKYEVNRTETIPVEKVDMSKVLSTETSGEHDLKLMTCGGKYDKNTKTFKDRVIVYAKIVK